MKAFIIDPVTQSVSEQEYDGQPNSLYTLFGSLLVDSHEILHEHRVYNSSEAYEKSEPGYFLGEKLLFGKALVIGSAGLQDTDATIQTEVLEQLSTFDLPDFYKNVLSLLPMEFSFDETYEIEQGGFDEPMSAEWVLYAYNMADQKTQIYFITELENAIAKGETIHGYLKKMGEMAIKSMQ